MAISIINGVELFHEARGTGHCLVLTHGSWTDGSGWGPTVDLLAERYRVVVWDRRGHSRSQRTDTAGSRAEDAADLAGLIEHVSDEPVHLAGNSYGANVTLTLLAARPDLVATAAVHEPPLFGVLDGATDAALSGALSTLGADLAVVGDLIRSGRRRDAAAFFIDHVALGPGSWEQLPDGFRSVLEANAPTYLDELADETALSIDAAAMAGCDVPLLLTHGTTSPVLFPAVIARLADVVPTATVAVLDGAGHIPHATHPDAWVRCITQFHDLVLPVSSGTRPAGDRPG